MEIAFALIGASAILALFCIFMLFRNKWTYDVRVKMLYENINNYYRLPDYDAMMWRIWVWDVNKFLK